MDARSTGRRNRTTKASSLPALVAVMEGRAISKAIKKIATPIKKYSDAVGPGRVPFSFAVVAPYFFWASSRT